MKNFSQKMRVNESFRRTDYGNQKGWERIPDPVRDVNEGVSTDDCFYPVTFDDELAF